MYYNQRNDSLPARNFSISIFLVRLFIFMEIFSRKHFWHNKTPYQNSQVEQIRFRNKLAWRAQKFITQRQCPRGYNRRWAGGVFLQHFCLKVSQGSRQKARYHHLRKENVCQSRSCGLQYVRRGRLGVPGTIARIGRYKFAVFRRTIGHRILLLPHTERQRPDKVFTPPAAGHSYYL